MYMEPWEWVENEWIFIFPINVHQKVFHTVELLNNQVDRMT